MKSLFVIFLLFFSTANVGAFQVFGGGAASTLDGQNASFYTDIRYQTGFINTTGILNWDSATGLVHADTGFDSHGTDFDSCEVIVDATDSTKVYIKPCHVHIGGPEYAFDGATTDPGFAAGENSRFIGVTMNGYTSQTSTWTNTQRRTIIPLARLNTPLGQLGPGSDVHLIRSDRYFIFENFYLDSLYHFEAIGAQYVTGGDIFSNATSGLILGQNEGVLYDGYKNRQELGTFENQSAIFLHLSSNETVWVGTKQPLIVDALNYNPAGSSLVPMLNDNTFTIHTILKSPKGVNGVQEGGLFFIYGDTEYATAAAAISAITDGSALSRFGVFVNQAKSGLSPAAWVLQQRHAAAVDTIDDRRPCQVCRP